jgi:hypothetical protein
MLRPTYSHGGTNLMAVSTHRAKKGELWQDYVVGHL